MFKYRKQLNTKFFKFGIQILWYTNVLCSMYQTDHLNQYIIKQDGVHLSGFQIVGMSGIQMALKNQNNWHPISFRPFEYQTRLVFRSPLQRTSQRLIFVMDFLLAIQIATFVSYFNGSLNSRPFSRLLCTICILDQSSIQIPTLLYFFRNYIIQCIFYCFIQVGVETTKEVTPSRKFQPKDL